jgi:hypothetical protein
LRPRALEMDCLSDPESSLSCIIISFAFGKGEDMDPSAGDDVADE